MIVERIFIGVIVLAAVILSKRYGSRHGRVIKWLCYAGAAIVWGAGQYWLQSSWIDMLISIIGIELFAWLIGGYPDDYKSSAAKRKSLR